MPAHGLSAAFTVDAGYKGFAVSAFMLFKWARRERRFSLSALMALFAFTAARQCAKATPVNVAKRDA